MIYAFIKANSKKWPVRKQCSALDVSASGFYDWQNRTPSQHAVANQNLLNDIRRIFWDIQRRLFESILYEYFANLSKIMGW